MGLDITAYSGLSAADDGDVLLSENMRAFAGRGDGIKTGLAYRAAQTFGFRAGSYSGYNEWREQLAKLAGYPLAPYNDDGKVSFRHAAGAWNATGGPFWELINFADNEGTIGPIVARKLAADFAQFEDQAFKLGDEWFLARYSDWKRAFEMAANHGAVEFH